MHSARVAEVSPDSCLAEEPASKLEEALSLPTDEPQETGSDPVAMLCPLVRQLPAALLLPCAMRNVQCAVSDCQDRARAKGLVNHCVGHQKGLRTFGGGI